MKDATRKTLIGVLILVVPIFVQRSLAYAHDTSPKPSSTEAKVPADLARRIGEVTDAVLQHHIDPPARQQMILGGIKALYQASGVPVPAGLSRRISALATPEQLAALIAELWPKSVSKTLSTRTLEDALFDGLLGSVPGGGHLLSARDRKVAEQMEGNRYVGIQIALAMDDEEKLTRISEIFEGGPAHRAGAMANDLIEKIDDTATKGMTITEVVNRLRGDEGTDVTITVRQKKAKEDADAQDDPYWRCRASPSTASARGRLGDGTCGSMDTTQSATSGSRRYPPALLTSFAIWRGSLKTKEPGPSCLTCAAGCKFPPSDGPSRR